MSHFYLFLALAAGVAGAYSITAGVAQALVGVMVAVALLPPLAASGLLFGGGFFIEGVGAMLLCLVNVVCINLAGVVTFLMEGIQPKEWWEAKKARKATIKAGLILFILFVLLIVILLLTNYKIV